MSDLEAGIRSVVREAVEEALADLELPGPDPEPEPESWRSRLHRVHPDTRLALGEAAEALGVSERSVRRYVAGDGDYRPLPARKGPTGLTVTAGDLRRWLEDVEGGNRFREARSG